MNYQKNNDDILLNIIDASSMQTKKISCKKGENLLSVLQNHNVFIPAYCGGRGTCGKCAISVKEGFLPITGEDRKHLSREALLSGMRLSCKAVLQENLTIAFDNLCESEFFIPENCDMSQIAPTPVRSCTDKNYAIAIDIGTTTLAFSLLELKNGKILGTHTAVNSQRSFGADVISRIQSANSGKKEILQNLIKKDLQHGCLFLIQKYNIVPGFLSHIAIAANTVMLHLLRGYSCEGLSHYPFTPKNLDFEEFSLKELLEDIPLSDFSPKITLLPGISAFVGADITSGLYACNIHSTPDVSLFLDLGTNGEMALKVNDKIFAASTAAGPVFEGGNIHAGMGSLKGAISQVEICKNIPKITTIQNAPPVGICGTGAIESAAELLTAKIMDKTGKLTEPYFSQGYCLAQTKDKKPILFYQKDIREIQMAKAAIRAGIEMLLMHANTPKTAIKTVYLAGGFGSFLNITKAAAIGLLPKEFIPKTKAVGNTSLKGALFYLSFCDKRPFFEIIQKSAVIPLANDENFQEMYLNHLNF